MALLPLICVTLFEILPGLPLAQNLVKASFEVQHPPPDLALLCGGRLSYPVTSWLAAGGLRSSLLWLADSRLVPKTRCGPPTRDEAWSVRSSDCHSVAARSVTAASRDLLSTHSSLLLGQQVVCWGWTPHG